MFDTSVGGRIVAFPLRPAVQRRSRRRSSSPADESERKAKIRSQVDGLNADGVEATVFVETTHHAAPREIARVAEEVGAEAIFCGTRGFAGIRRALAGSVAAELLHYSHVPVVAVPAVEPVEAEPAEPVARR